MLPAYSAVVAVVGVHPRGGVRTAVLKAPLPQHPTHILASDVRDHPPPGSVCMPAGRAGIRGTGDVRALVRPDRCRDERRLVDTALPDAPEPLLKFVAVEDRSTCTVSDRAAVDRHQFTARHRRQVDGHPFVIFSIDETLVDTRRTVVEIPYRARQDVASDVPGEVMTADRTHAHAKTVKPADLAAVVRSVPSRIGGVCRENEGRSRSARRNARVKVKVFADTVRRSGVCRAVPVAGGVQVLRHRAGAPVGRAVNVDEHRGDVQRPALRSIGRAGVDTDRHVVAASHLVALVVVAAQGDPSV